MGKFIEMDSNVNVSLEANINKKPVPNNNGT